MTLNGSLEMARAIALVRTFLKQKFLAGFCYAKKKLAPSRFQHALLDLRQLYFQNLFQLIGGQRMKDDQLVQAVPDFRDKFASRSSHARRPSLLVPTPVRVFLPPNR